MPSSLPRGYFKAVRFPVLALLNKTTGDHRRLNADGGRTRDLPLSIKAQFKTSFGHDGAELSGGLFEVTFDPDAHADYGVVSGRGFLRDDPVGRRHAQAIHLGMMRGNSVDLADVKARFVEDFDTDDWWVEFYEWALAATTGVSTPAFAEAYAEVDPLTDEELMASLVGADPMEELVASFELSDLDLNVLMPQPVEDIPAEVLASGIVQKWDHFHVPEAERLQKIVVGADGVVCGHLGPWEMPHVGIDGKRVTIPRPRDGYASFNKPGVLTERGIVQTGPIFAYGGHRSLRGAKSAADAYGGVENSWADVRIVEGKHGPWISGVVRPGVADETVYAARASRISGHWLGDRLHAIVSVNAEGFPVDGNPDVDAFALDASTEFAQSITDGVLELVASFPDSLASDPNTVTLSDEEIKRLLEAASEGGLVVMRAPVAALSEISVNAIDEAPGADAAALMLALLLDDEDDE